MESFPIANGECVLAQFSFSMNLWNGIEYGRGQRIYVAAAAVVVAASVPADSVALSRSTIFEMKIELFFAISSTRWKLCAYIVYNWSNWVK